MSKGPDAFRTISEVAQELDLPQHVLRFWETRFSQIKPMKRGGGRRYYRPDDIDLLRGIKHLLYEEGYTIRGLQRIFKEQGNGFVIAVGKGEIAADEDGWPATLAIGLTQPGDAGQEPETETETEGGTAPIVPEQEPAEERRGPAKQAVPVRELSGGGSKSLLGRLRGRDEADRAATGGTGLTGEGRRNLQATLYELLECKRLLDQVREQ